jgi:hypothetical protein
MEKRLFHTWLANDTSALQNLSLFNEVARLHARKLCGAKLNLLDLLIRQASRVNSALKLHRSHPIGPIGKAPAGNNVLYTAHYKYPRFLVADYPFKTARVLNWIARNNLPRFTRKLDDLIPNFKKPELSLRGAP